MDAAAVLLLAGRAGLFPKGRAPPLEPGLLVVSTTTGMASMVEATPACASITAYEDATATAVAEPPGVASGCAAA